MNRAKRAFVILLLGFSAPTTSVSASTRYQAIPLVTTQDATVVADRGKPLATYRLTPSTAVELQGVLDPEVALKAAVTASVPFVPGRTLYGGEDRPGLYCDLMRNRGLGSSTACLRDTDMDGRFDQAVRYDFNAYASSMIFITDKGKLRGGSLKATVPLGQPIAYRVLADAVMPTAEVSLLWSAQSRKRGDGTKQTEIELVVADGANFTGTESVSQKYVKATLGKTPLEVDFYGIKLVLRELTKKNDLVYSAKLYAKSLPIDFSFKADEYRFVIYLY